jgi:general secretion pathway protein M
MAAQVRAITASVSEWFEARAPREKRLLLAGGALTVVAIVYNLLWAPAWDGCIQIRASLPLLEVQLADIQMQVDQARQLKGQAAVRAPSGVALRDTLATSLVQAGIPEAQVATLGKGVQIDVKNAPFGAWMSWLDSVRRDDHVRVVNAQLIAEGKVGQVTVSATLQPTSEPR